MKILRVVFVLILSASVTRAADGVTDAPTSLVISYRSRPETRAAFRAWLTGQGAAQFARWQHDGIFSDSEILFTSFAATSVVDAIVILHFAHYTDSARWKMIERTSPGGLSPEALLLAAPESACYADSLGHSQGAQHDPARAAYMITFYEVLSDTPKYQSYSAGYTLPQMRGWMEAGVLSGFDLYLNQAPLGKPWDAMLVLEYADIAALARRDEVKSSVRAHLAATDAKWLEWSKDKSAIRREFSLMIADAIVPGAP
jgi:hypothetical protein